MTVHIAVQSTHSLMLKSWLFLFAAIICEVIATAFIKVSEEFTKVVPSAVVIIGYALSFYLWSWVLEGIPVGVAYAVWAGMVVVLVGLVDLFFFGQTLDAAALTGMTLIVAGVVCINLFSKSVVH